MKGWFENMKIVERDSSETGNGDEGDENSGEDESNAGHVIELTADDADLSEAPDVIVEGDPHNLGGWHGENTVIFHMNLEEAGAYRVILVYSKEESVGDPAKLRITAQNKDSDSSGSGYFNIPATGNDWSNYVERELGTFNHLEAGETVLRMESEEPQRGRYVMNLRSIKLLPADE
jgi:hypothetical protein